MDGGHLIDFTPCPRAIGSSDGYDPIIQAMWIDAEYLTNGRLYILYWNCDDWNLRKSPMFMWRSYQSFRLEKSLSLQLGDFGDSHFGI